MISTYRCYTTCQEVTGTERARRGAAIKGPRLRAHASTGQTAAAQLRCHGATGGRQGRLGAAAVRAGRRVQHTAGLPGSDALDGVVADRLRAAVRAVELRHGGAVDVAAAADGALRVAADVAAGILEAELAELGEVRGAVRAQGAASSWMQMPVSPSRERSVPPSAQTMHCVGAVGCSPSTVILTLMNCPFTKFCTTSTNSCA